MGRAGAAPGERRGGRAKGVVNKNIQYRVQLAQALGKTGHALTPVVEIVEEWSKLFALTVNQVPELFETGIRHDRREANDLLAQAARILRDMAPYVKPRMVAVNVSGNAAAPLHVQHTVDLTRLSDDELEMLITVSGKLIEGTATAEVTSGKQRQQDGDK